MRICLADSNQSVLNHVFEKAGMPILFSFYYGKEMVPALRAMLPKLKKPPPVYLDSGVFSARKRNETIDTDKLIAFYHKNADLIDWVFNNDEGSPAQQLRICKKMAAAGVPVIGIYHGTMPLEYISKFAEVSPYVAVSFFVLGIKQVLALSPSNPARKEYLDGVFAYVHRKGLWPLRLHALGTEQGNLLQTYPFYSCDATGYASDYMFNKVTTYDPVKWRFTSYQLKDRKELARALEITGVDAAKAAAKGKDGYVARALISAAARKQLQDALTNLWTSRGITWPE